MINVKTQEFLISIAYNILDYWADNLSDSVERQDKKSVLIESNELKRPKGEDPDGAN